MTLNPVTTSIDWQVVPYLPHTMMATICGQMVFLYHNPIIRPNLWHIWAIGSHEPWTARSLASAEVSALRMVESLVAPKEETSMSPPRDPTQVPPGDPADAVKPGNPTPSEFNEGDDVDEEDPEDDEDDDTYEDGEDD